MVDHCCSHVVVSALMTLVDCTEKVHHVFKELASLVPLANAVNTFDNDLVNDLTCVPIDQDDPLVNEISFGSELDVDSLEHLNAPHNVVKSCLRWSLATYLVHQD